MMAGGPLQHIEVEPGVKLAVRLHGDVKNPAIVLSNSLATSMGMWDEIVDRLSSRYYLVCYDARGHGSSDGPATGYSVERLGLDIVALLDSLKLQRAVLCGVSLGGLTGMWFAVSHPSRLAGLVLANTSSSFSPAQMWRERAGIARKDGVDGFVAPSIDRWLTKALQDRHPERVRDLGRMVSSTSRQGYAACCETLANTDLGAELARISCPTLVIGGRHDPSVTTERSRMLAAAVPHAIYRELDAAHISPVEAPDEFASAVGDFLKSNQ